MLLQIIKSGPQSKNMNSRMMTAADNLSEIPLNQSYELERVPTAAHWSKSVETIARGGGFEQVGFQVE